MDIERFDFFPANSPDVATTMGINMQKKYGITHVNLFALAESKGEPIGSNIWGIAKAISNEILMAKNIDELNWTLTSGDSSTGIELSTLHGQPYKLDVSDKFAFFHEKYEFNRFTLDRYAKEFAGQPPVHVSEGRTRSYEPDVRPETIFCVPCDHPDAKDGVFYCRPSYYDADHMHDNYEFILADTRKIIDLLQQDDPDMIRHAEWKMKNETAEQWLQSTKIEYPRDMGYWTYNSNSGLGFCSGHAELIKVAADLNLPYFPIAVSKAEGFSNIEELKRKVSYIENFNAYAPNMQPAYTPES